MRLACILLLNRLVKSPYDKAISRYDKALMFQGRFLKEYILLKKETLYGSVTYRVTLNINNHKFTTSY